MAVVLIPISESLPPPLLDRQDVHVWSCDLSQLEHDRATFAAFLSIDEQSRAARFAFAQDRQRFTLSHGLLRVILSRYVAEEPGQIQFDIGPHGKPAIRHRSDTTMRIAFSLSHSAQYAAIAVASGRAVGVDVEVCRLEVDALKLAQRFFASGESQRIAEAHGSEKPQAFYQYWTGKEAYLKGRGLGLSLGLDRFELLFDEQLVRAQVRSTESGILDKDWSVQSLSIADHVAGALAVEGEDWRAHMFDAARLCR
jgi:4'-phosphopantetheinyl transferase